MDGDMDGDMYKGRLDGWVSIWMLMDDGGLMNGWVDWKSNQWSHEGRDG